MAHDKPNILAACILTAAVVFGQGHAGTIQLRARADPASQAIKIYRSGVVEPILTQKVPDDGRPYLHPIVAPDGNGLITEYRPSHHPHQTGIYWGFKLVNNREFFMHWQGDHYRKISFKVIQQEGQQVKWQTVYDLLDESASPMLTETQNWAMQESGGKYILDLDWRGHANTDLTFEKFYVGGLFIRIPWRPEDHAEAVNSDGQRDGDAEQQHAKWADVGIQIVGRTSLAHIAVFDSPHNAGFPTAWRVDNQFGFGPNTEATEWKLAKGTEKVLRYRLMAYCGDLDVAAMTKAWNQFAKEH